MYLYAYWCIHAEWKKSHRFASFRFVQWNVVNFIGSLWFIHWVFPTVSFYRISFLTSLQECRWGRRVPMEAVESFHSTIVRLWRQTVLWSEKTAANKSKWKALYNCMYVNVNARKMKYFYLLRFVHNNGKTMVSILTGANVYG